MSYFLYTYCQSSNAFNKVIHAETEKTEEKNRKRQEQKFISKNDYQDTRLAGMVEG